MVIERSHLDLSRNWYEKYFHNTGVAYSFFITTIIAIGLQLLGHWELMIFAGAFGCVYVKRHTHAFIAGFLGVAVSWSILFMILVQFSQAYVVAELFATLIGAAGLGRFIVSLSILIGGFLGGSGALVGYSFINLVDEYRSSETSTTIDI
jgi:hypothetical protein